MCGFCVFKLFFYGKPLKSDLQRRIVWGGLERGRIQIVIIYYRSMAIAIESDAMEIVTVKFSRETFGERLIKAVYMFICNAIKILLPSFDVSDRDKDVELLFLNHIMRFYGPKGDADSTKFSCFIAFPEPWTTQISTKFYWFLSVLIGDSSFKRSSFGSFAIIYCASDFHWSLKFRQLFRDARADKELNVAIN